MGAAASTIFFFVSSPLPIPFASGPRFETVRSHPGTLRRLLGCPGRQKGLKNLKAPIFATGRSHSHPTVQKRPLEGAENETELTDPMGIDAGDGGGRRRASAVAAG